MRRNIALKGNAGSKVSAGIFTSIQPAGNKHNAGPIMSLDKGFNPVKFSF